ncbi:subclass B1 metallo-beta-lactamase [Deminuibacter soli]|nr:subclass B1 metallo-beta-lactamase [Deminuibacter soli]
MKRALLFAICLLLCSLLRTATAQNHTPALEITHITDSIYKFTTWRMLNNAPFPSNSLYVLTPAGAVLIDCAWDTTQFQPLLDTIAARHRQQVIACIATHSHADRTCMFHFLQAHGIATWSSEKTYEQCKLHGNQLAAQYFVNDTTFDFGGYTIQTFYPGEGHTSDNIVIWFNHAKLLYGGCFVKSLEAHDLGYVEESNVQAWPASIRNVQHHFKHIRYLVPGHQGGTSVQALPHTLHLLEELHVKNAVYNQ